jgi:hypothetical protein
MRNCVDVQLKHLKGLIMTSQEDPEHFNAYLRAEEAAGRGDAAEAERWINLMERQCATLERVVEMMRKIDYDDIGILQATEHLPNRAARRAARKDFFKKT